MLTFEDEILAKTGGNVKRFSATRLVKGLSNKVEKNRKHEHWTTFCETYEQPVWQKHCGKRTAGCVLYSLLPDSCGDS